jgi:hypothetical protein
VASARSWRGNHVATTRPFAGKHGDSAMPSNSRRPSSDAIPPTIAWNSVNNDQNPTDRQ